mmetsp:Transcript_21622/g.40393  ORF Transcript_21622/g.40393 Transcript_21622/m.40393 type:complete len:851 (-) Transcript_21622:271-2823(-)
MEEIDVDPETVAKWEEVDTKRRSARRLEKEKKKKQLTRQLSHHEMREELGLTEVPLQCKFFLVFLAIFAMMALIGGVMQVASKNGGQALQVVDHGDTGLEASVTKEAFVLACETTWVAAKMWGRLLVAIILPTSHRTFLITKDGFSAMQPSIRASWVFLLNTHWTTKMAILGVVTGLFALWMLERHIRKQRYVERTQEWYQAKYDAVYDKYSWFLGGVRRESQIVADLFPHMLFFAVAFAVFLLAKNQFIEWSKGLGGWYTVIAIPTVLTTRALIVYDLAYRAQVEKINLTRHREISRTRTFSHLPTPDAAKAQNLDLGSKVWRWVQSWWPWDINGNKSVGDDDASSVGSLDSNEVSVVEGIRYPKSLEQDPEASLEQYRELSIVIYWLEYWTVLGLALLVEQLPLTGHMLAVLPVWPPFRVMLSLWLQIPGTAGASLAFKLLVPLISRTFSLGSGVVSHEQSNLIVNFLYAFHIIGPKTRVKLTEVFQTGGVVLMVALPFFFMPAVFTGIGAVLIGVARPVASSTRVLLDVERAQQLTLAAASSTDPKAGQNFKASLAKGVSITSSAVQLTQWGEYWVMYSLFMLVNGFLSPILFWFPFYQHALLVATLWLQLPYFRGARNIFKVALMVFYKIRSYFVSDSLGDPVPGGNPSSLPPILEEKRTSHRSTKTASSRHSHKTTVSVASEQTSSWWPKLWSVSSPKTAPVSRTSSKRASQRSFDSDDELYDGTGRAEVFSDFDEDGEEEEEIKQIAADSEEESFSLGRSRRSVLGAEEDESLTRSDTLGEDHEDATTLGSQDSDDELLSTRHKSQESEVRRRSSKKKKKNRKSHKSTNDELADSKASSCWAIQ